MKLRQVIAIGLAAACLSQQSAGAAEIEGVGFLDRLSVGAAELRLHGTGLLRYRVFFKGYVAALYLGDSFDGEATPRAVLADVPRRLEIEYFWSIRAEKFAEATVEGISRSAEPATFESGVRNRQHSRGFAAASAGSMPSTKTSNRATATRSRTYLESARSWRSTAADLA
jgi:hypothetical protein